MVKLMELLGDTEAIRNEALLLLIRLTHGHEEIQKIVAYGDAFDTLFSIIAAEGYAAGGVLVHVRLAAACQLIVCLGSCMPNGMWSMRARSLWALGCMAT